MSRSFRWADHEKKWWLENVKGTKDKFRSSSLIYEWFRKFHRKSYSSVSSYLGTDCTASRFCQMANAMHPTLVREFNEKMARFVKYREEGIA